MSRRYMDIAEFRKLGYVQEINRRFLHPLGLALEVTVEDDGTERISGVWDGRDDPEGYYFDDLTREDAERVSRMGAELTARSPARVAALGYVVQPLPSTEA